MRNLAFGLIALMIMTSGCSLFRKSGGTSRVARIQEETLKKTTEANLDFERMNINGKGKLALPIEAMKNLNVSYRINWIKDSAILIKLRVSVLSVATVHLTPDVATILDRVNKEYYEVPTDSLEKLAGMPLDFGMIQDLLLGNFRRVSDDLVLQNPDTNPVLLEGTFRNGDVRYSINPDIYKVVEIRFQDGYKQQDASLTFADHQNLGKEVVPYKVGLDVRSPEAASAVLQHKKMEMNPDNFRLNFSIPANYEKKDFTKPER
ncbi:MAG: DUF4292 domain-containing protein [Bacteroidota bacterium]